MKDHLSKLFDQGSKIDLSLAEIEFDGTVTREFLIISCRKP